MKRLPILLAVALAITVVTATPVYAKRSLRVHVSVEQKAAHKVVFRVKTSHSGRVRIHVYRGKHRVKSMKARRSRKSRKVYYATWKGSSVKKNTYRYRVVGTKRRYRRSVKRGKIVVWETKPKPVPSQMARVGNAHQLIVITGRRLGSKTGTLRFFNRENGIWVCKLAVTAKFGKRGLTNGKRRREGNKTTPTGIWKMPDFVFGYARHAPAGTKMAYRRINGRTWWSSRRGRTYNTWVRAKRWRGEYLYNVVPQYEFAVSTGYNARPNRSVYGRGSGIFLHVRGKGLTAGCVAISRRSMIRVLQLLDPAKRPACAVGTLQWGTKTSIWAY